MTYHKKKRKTKYHKFKDYSKRVEYVKQASLAHKPINSLQAEISAKLKAARKAKGLTALQVAARLRIDESTIYKWESGKYPMTIRTVQRYLDCIRVNKVELLVDY